MTGKADAIADVERLAQIRERCEKATPGPWVYDVLAEEIRTAHGEPILDCGRADQFDSDGEFAAHAREDIPWLLHELALARDLAAQRGIMHGEAQARLNKDSERLEFAMANLFIVDDCGPNTTRVYDTRGALDQAMEKEKKS